MTEILVGKIKYDPTAILGKGRSKTVKSVVYKGSFGIIDVAVKEVLQRDFIILENNGMEFYKKLGHTNIVRIFWMGQHGQNNPTCYIAMEICDMNYEQYFQSNKQRQQQGIKNFRRKLDCINVIQQVLSGLDYLHKNNLIHGDLNPRNVMVCMATQCAKISDYGFKKPSKIMVSFQSLASFNLSLY